MLRGAATVSPRTAVETIPTQRFESLVEDLEAADYVNVDRVEEDSHLAPPGSMFVVVGGSAEDMPFPVSDFAVAMVRALGSRGVTVLAGEPSDSTWDVVGSIREDGEAHDSVATVDQVETTAGRMAVVLGLDHAGQGVPGHYGTAAGADDILPQPLSS